MAILKKDLQAVKRDIKALEKKMEKLLNAYETPQKPKTAKKVKKKTVKVKTKRAAAVKKAALPKKTAKKTTSTDQILKIIRRSRKGVDVPALKAKTGFEDKKVRNIIFRASKEGKIKKVGRGIYVGA
jgi:predicted helicase